MGMKKLIQFSLRFLCITFLFNTDKQRQNILYMSTVRCLDTYMLFIKWALVALIFPINVFNFS